MSAFYSPTDEMLTSPSHQHPSSFHSSSQDPYSSSSMGGVMLCNMDINSPHTISPLTREPRSSGYPMSSGNRYTPYPYSTAASKRFAQHPDSSPAPGLHFPGQGLGFGLTSHESQMGFDEEGPTPNTMVRIGSKRGYNAMESPTKRPENKRAKTTGMLTALPSLPPPLPRTSSSYTLIPTQSRNVSGHSMTSSTSAQLITPSLIPGDEIDPLLSSEYGGLTTSQSAPALGGVGSEYSLDDAPPFVNYWPNKLRRASDIPPVADLPVESAQPVFEDVPAQLQEVVSGFESTPIPPSITPPSTGATPPKLSVEAIDLHDQVSAQTHPTLQTVHPSSIASTPAIPHLAHPGPSDQTRWQPLPNAYPPQHPPQHWRNQPWVSSKQPHDSNHMYPPQHPLQRALSDQSIQCTQPSPYGFPEYQSYHPSYPRNHYQTPSRPASTGPFPSMRSSGMPTSGSERGLFGHPSYAESSTMGSMQGLHESYMAQSAYEVPLRHQLHPPNVYDPALQQAGPSHFDGSLSLEGSPEQLHRPTVGSRKYSYQSNIGMSRRSSQEDDGVLSPASLSPDPQDDNNGGIQLGQPLPHPSTHIHPHPSQPYNNQYHPLGPQELETHIHGSSFRAAGAPPVALHLTPAHSQQGRANHIRGPGLDKDFLSRLYKSAMVPDEKQPQTMVKRFLCLIEGCERSLPRRSAIISHVQTHLGDKQFACDTCGLAFVRQHDLKRHEKIHSEEKPFLCPCGKKFARGDALSRHQERPRYCIGSKVQE